MVEGEATDAAVELAEFRLEAEVLEVCTYVVWEGSRVVEREGEGGGSTSGVGGEGEDSDDAGEDDEDLRSDLAEDFAGGVEEGYESREHPWNGSGRRSSPSRLLYV